jgi:transcriptional regulator
MSDRDFDFDILLGCAVLQSVAPGVPKSQSEIAHACGCSRSAIFLIEHKAIRKIKKKKAYNRAPSWWTELNPRQSMKLTPRSKIKP